ncbi:hypothetical protein Barb4_04268 [Bacteroidales bacterium Barb4]|nr:hypothetical protein Barb4_04268 [Bacteroidales bacterium Barb4]
MRIIDRISHASCPAYAYCKFGKVGGSKQFIIHRHLAKVIAKLFATVQTDGYLQSLHVED